MSHAKISSRPSCIIYRPKSKVLPQTYLQPLCTTIVIQRNNYRYIRVYDKITTKNKSFSVPTSELTELTFPKFELGQTVLYQGPNYGNIKTNSIVTIVQINKAPEFSYQIQQDKQLKLICPFEIRTVDY